MDSYNFIKRVVHKCFTSDICDVRFHTIRSELVTQKIITTFQKNELDALKTDARQTEKLFLEYAPTFGIDNFQKLIGIISVDYPDVSNAIIEAWKSCNNTNKNPSITSQLVSPVTCSASETYSPRGEICESTIHDQEMAFTELPSNFNIAGNECEGNMSSYNPNQGRNPQNSFISGDEITYKKAFLNQTSDEQAKMQAEMDITYKKAFLNQSSDEQAKKQKQVLDQTGAADETTLKKTLPQMFNVPLTRRYRMDTQPRGVAFIINNITFSCFKERSGTEIDRDKLCIMFKNLGWKVTTKVNLTAQKMDEYLKKFARHDSLNSSSALAVAILTHGMNNDIYFGTDGDFKPSTSTPAPGTYLNRFELMQTFTGRHCRAMNGKPKWFIIQACRGSEEDSVQPIKRERERKPARANLLSSDWPEPDYTEYEPHMIKSPETGDMCFMFASSVGYKAYRIKGRGSPFIKALTETVPELAEQNKEFREIMNEVRYKLYNEQLPDGRKTLPEFSNQLVNDWFLIPHQSQR